MIRVNFLCLVLALCVASCKDQKTPGSGHANTSATEGSSNDTPAERTSLSHPFITDEEYAALAEKARSGDSEAAFALFNQFTYGKRDYGLAYFWAIKARALGNEKITDKTLAICEANIMSAAVSKDPNWQPPESVDEIPLPDE